MREGASRPRGDTLEYIQSMLGQLRAMAHAEQCDMLAYLIEMAYVEAGDMLRSQRQSQQKRNSAA